MPATEAPSKQISIYDIAAATGYTPAGIHKAIERLGLEPEMTTPNGTRYFSRLVIPILKDHMRVKPKNGAS
jgi:hypothetical protein